MRLGAAASVSAALPGRAASAAVPIRSVATPVLASSVKIEDPFWSPKLALWRSTTIADCFTKFENDRGGAINNFDNVRDGRKGKHAGPEWYDGLIYEMICGSADYLAQQRDAALEARIDGIIDRIVAAQNVEPDGYLNTFTQSMLPQTMRWGRNGGDDRGQHDVYNAGMLIEAGVHYYQATGKPKLLTAAAKMANLMCNTIGPSPRANVIPGHSGPEYSLIQLYLLFTQSRAAAKAVSVPVTPARYLELARFFINMRGRYEGRSGKEASFGEYGQDHAVLEKQTSLEGHAVRATLFATGVAATAGVTGKQEYLDAATRFWKSLADKKLYISGAAGAIAGEEKLGADYFLPNDGYMETCAAVGVGFFGKEMHQLTGDARYMDTLERALYNAVPGGVSLAGNQYYYQNPLEGEGLRRWNWHDCPCCPPMFLKLTGALPGLIYSTTAQGICVNLYVGSTAAIAVQGTKATLKLTTRYPWDGRIVLQVETAKPTTFDLLLRIPAWCEPAQSSALYHAEEAQNNAAIELKVDGKPTSITNRQMGYVRIRRKWSGKSFVELTLPMPVRLEAARTEVEADRGRVALMRGPVLYCLEGADNAMPLKSLVVAGRGAFTAQYRPNLLGGVAVITGGAIQRSRKAGSIVDTDVQIQAIPFYASANRQACAMQVWLANQPEKAVPATLATLSTATASHCWHLDSVAAINDGTVPLRSDDISHSRLSWWDHKGTQEWAQLTFPKPSTVSEVRVFWFADRDVRGGCDLPASWRLMVRVGDEWQEVEKASAYGLHPDVFNKVTFRPVVTTALRIVVQLKPEWSGGICEIEVD